MTTKFFGHDIDLGNVGQLVGTRLQNVADQATEDTLAGALGVSNEGLVIYRVDNDLIKFWDGSQFNSITAQVDGDIIFKGLYDASLAIDDAGQPQAIEPVAGYQYVATTAGTFNAGGSGVTLNGQQELRVGDQILFTSATEAYVIQRNIDAATDSVDGIVYLADQIEVDNGVSTEPNTAVTPETLQAKLDGQFYTRQHTETVNLTIATPETITHNLGLVNKDAFAINTMGSNGSQISLDVDSVDENSLTVTSLLPLNGVVVTVVGAKSV